MPAKSEKHRRTAGEALAGKRGEKPMSELSLPAKQMAKGMTEKELRDFARKQTGGKGR